MNHGKRLLVLCDCPTAVCTHNPEPVQQSSRMQWGWYRWCVTYIYAWFLLNQYGERAWPWNVRFIWSVARKEVDGLFPRK